MKSRHDSRVGGFAKHTSQSTLMDYPGTSWRPAFSSIFWKLPMTPWFWFTVFQWLA